MTEQFVNWEMRQTKSGEYAVWIAALGVWQSLQGSWVASRDRDGNLGPPRNDLPLIPEGARIVSL